MWVEYSQRLWCVMGGPGWKYLVECDGRLLLCRSGLKGVVGYKVYETKVRNVLIGSVKDREMHGAPVRNRDIAASRGLRRKLYCSSKSIVVKASTQNPLKVKGFSADAAAKFHASNTDNGVLSLAQGERRADSGSSDLSILSSGDDEGGGTGMKKLDHFYDGKLAEDGLTFRQNFIIRSYEIDRDRRAFFESLMNFSQ
ncbi:hypothetical protein Droror1_Dr00024558, partial [Drosera rotundifolia]